MLWTAVSAVLRIILGGLVVASLPRNPAHVSGLSGPSFASQADQVATYVQVREGNMGPLQQALNGLRSDCMQGDDGRCSLSAAYTLALVQKFEDEIQASQTLLASAQCP
jgi:hypothetical protein